MNEFEKILKEYYPEFNFDEGEGGRTAEVFMDRASWMVERCIKSVESIEAVGDELYQGKAVAERLRQLSKELLGDKPTEGQGGRT